MNEPRTAPSPDTTVSGLLRALAAERPETEALVYPAFAWGGVGLRHTFASLDRAVDDAARGLVAAGVAAGDHVAVWGGNVPDWVVLEYALARIGAVLVTVNTALQRDEVAYLLEQSGATAVVHTTRVGSNEVSATLDALLAEDGGPARGIRLRAWIPTGPDERPPEGTLPGGRRERLPTLAGWIDAGRDVSTDALAARERAVVATDVVNIQYTSGTTGFPKGVMLSHANLLCNAFALGEQIRSRPGDRVALMVPLFHCFGCVVAVLGAATHGATLCAIQGFEPEAALRLVHEERCTIIHGVPTMYSAMIGHPERERYDTSSLRAGLAAGAPCPVPLMQAIIDDLRCAGISVAYGLTEASPGVSGSNPEDPVEVRCRTIGRPLPDVEVRIVDPQSGADVPDGGEGELLVRGPNVMVGYHDDPTATASSLTADGWLHTGDLVTRGDDGNLRIVGRSKDIIIRGGENIAPAEIENVLREHPDIADAAVVGIPDPHFGEEVAGALVLQDGCSLDPQSYERLLEGRVASFKVPRVWRSFDRFPLTGSGKVQKFRLRDMMARREPAS